MSTKLERIFSESKSISNDIASKQFNIDDVDYKRVLTEFQKMISQMSQSSAGSSNNNNAQSASGRSRGSSSGNNNNNNNNANSKTKRVTFSDHIVDFDQNTSDDDADSQEMESTTASWSPSLSTTTTQPLQTNTGAKNTAQSPNTAQMTQENQNFYMSFFQDALQKTHPALVKDSEPSMTTVNSAEDDFTTSSQIDDTSQTTPTSTAAPKGLGLLGPLTDKALDLIKTEKR